MAAADVIAHARQAFGWGGDIRVSDGPRGAVGRLWRVDVDDASYAVKELVDEPPTAESIGAERIFARCASAAGARVPASYADRAGRYVIPTPHGTWLRCSEWIDLRPLDFEAPDVPRRLGQLIAGLHRAAPHTAVEPDGGGPADPWYDRLPDDRACPGGRPDGALATPVDPERLILCHRDLHPQNVFTDAGGRLVVVDCDDVGPAEPGRELARIAFDWFCDSQRADLEAVRGLLGAYVDAGGPGRIVDRADFSMLWACRLNFLVEQRLIAGDPLLDEARREWAAHEAELMRRLMPTVGQLDAVLAIARGVS